MSERERFTVMDGTVALYDAEFDERGNGYVLAWYQHPTKREPRYPQKQLAMLKAPPAPR